MQGLLVPDDVDEPGGTETARTVAHAGQVGRRVAVPAVRLAHDERERLAVAILESLGEHTEGPVVLDQEALLVELGDDDGQQRVVEALPHDVLGSEEDTEQLVDLAGVAHGLGDEDAPQVQRLLVAGLQEHHTIAAALGEIEVAVELSSGRGVELVEIPHAERLGIGRPVHVEQVLDEHAERCAPVADVVLAMHVVPEEPEHAGEGVSDEGAAEMADVHLLGHVGRRVVDDHGLRAGDSFDAQSLVGGERRHQAGHEAVGQRQVDEAGPADLDLGTDVIEGRRRHDLFGHLARRAAHQLPERQRAVGLEVGPVRDPQHRVGPGCDGVEGGLQPLEEDAGGVGHSLLSHARPALKPAIRRAWALVPAPTQTQTPQAAGAPMPPSSKP